MDYIEPRLEDAGGPPRPLRSEKGDLETVGALLSGGANVNAVDPEGRTALHLSARCGNQLLVSRLLERGADSNARDGQGRTPLHHAASQHSEKIINLLIEHGADVNAEDQQGRSPLHDAAALHNLNAVRALLAAGADPDRTGCGKRPEELARQDGRGGSVADMLARASGENKEKRPRGPGRSR